MSSEPQYQLIVNRDYCRAQPFIPTGCPILEKAEALTIVCHVLYCLAQMEPHPENKLVLPYVRARFQLLKARGVIADAIESLHKEHSLKARAEFVEATPAKVEFKMVEADTQAGITANHGFVFTLDLADEYILRRLLLSREHAQRLYSQYPEMFDGPPKEAN